MMYAHQECFECYRKMMWALLALAFFAAGACAQCTGEPGPGMTRIPLARRHYGPFQAPLNAVQSSEKDAQYVIRTKDSGKQGAIGDRGAVRQVQYGAETDTGHNI